MREAINPTTYVSPRSVGVSFALSGLASCLMMWVALKSEGLALAFGTPKSQGGTLALIGTPWVILLVGAWAASRLRIGRLAPFGVGFAIVVGTIGSFSAVMGTQGIGPDDTVIRLLFFTFMPWFVTVYGVGSAVGLLPMLTHGAKVYAIGVLGFCGGAAIIAVMFVFMAMSNVLTLETVVLLTQLPGIVGGISLAWALNVVRRSGQRVGGKHGVSDEK